MMKPKAETLYYYIFAADAPVFCFSLYKAEMQIPAYCIQCVYSFIFISYATAYVLAWP